MARFALALIALAAAPAMAQFNEANFVQAIPPLDEIGLGALIAVVAAAAGWAIRRSKRK